MSVTGMARTFWIFKQIRETLARFVRFDTDGREFAGFLPAGPRTCQRSPPATDDLILHEVGKKCLDATYYKRLLQRGL